MKENSGGSSVFLNVQNFTDKYAKFQICIQPDLKHTICHLIYIVELCQVCLIIIVFLINILFANFIKVEAVVGEHRNNICRLCKCFV